MGWKKKAFHQACKSPAIIRNWYKACLACVGICRNNYQFYSGIGSLPYIFDLNGSASCFFFQASAHAHQDEKTGVILQLVVQVLIESNLFYMRLSSCFFSLICYQIN
ncbi:TPA: hypothetical protein ACF2PS_002875 [Legionella pneumophila]|uniref:hypothetical protein n=1 Tax=Legionella pneumophila TaxID=446 RepID=UPI0004851AC8|nr:hypothetical protein [Legionella pneumophila]APF03842.1 hypothetical protein BIZ52_10940 [Legionella pneumophila subsp. fraseri]APF06921.1 hypothetical protein BIZ51_11335 [Legionella pneumophila subsp. fraseri]AUB69376.1 hypothetical protein BJK09_11245 [Legionella pneumophila]AUB72348.1 hypothetical protein BJK08_11240 [Legionella pneumophila]KXB27571.1 hypothetical protein PtVF89_04805 [Legionella pneumophila]